MPSKIEVTYFPVMTKYGVIHTPQIFISISHKSIRSVLFYALIDSGADLNLFPASLGKIIGVDIEKGKIVNVLGIGSQRIVAYKHKLNLHVFDRIYQTEIYFSYNQQDPLLGRNGFFNLFSKVFFDEKKRNVTLKI